MGNKKTNIRTVLTIFVLFIIYEFLIKPFLIGILIIPLILLIKFIILTAFYYLTGFIINYKKKPIETPVDETK